MNQKKKGFGKIFESTGVKLVLAFTIPVIVLLIIIMVYMLTRPEEIVEPRLVIDNFSEMLPDVSKETEQRIEERLYNYVAESGVEVIPEDGAMIREGSVDGFTIQEKFHVGDFIVDIAEVEQSYIIEYYYGQLEDKQETEGSASVMVYCIEDPDEVVYATFVCKANRDFVKPDPIQFILPQAFSDYSLSYTYSLTSESGYAVVITYDPPESVYLSGKVEEFENKTMDEIREYLTRLGLEPDRYEFVSKYKIVE